MLGRWEFLGVVVLTALAAVLRVAAAGDPLSGGELGTFVVAGGGSLADVIDAVRSDRAIAPPGSYVLAYATLQLGDTDTWLRGASVIAGTLAVPFTYGLGRRTVGPVGAAAGAGLLAICPFAIAVSALAEPFAIALAFVALTAWVGLVALERNRFGWWAVFAVLTAAALYVHYAVLLTAGAWLVWALWTHTERWRGILLSTFASIALFAPWLPALLDDRAAPLRDAVTRATPFDAEWIGETLVRWLAGAPGMALSDVPGTVGLALLILTGAIAIAGAIAMLWPRPRGKVVALPWRSWEPGAPPRLTGPPRVTSGRATSALVYLLAVVVPVGLVVHSLVAADVFTAAPLAVASAPLMLTLGAIVAWLRPPVGAVALLALASGFGVGVYALL
jgi:Dolichyl-phosphate-mannose-protein mannosyltransferase